MTVRRFLARGAAVLSVALLSTAGLAFAVGASAGAKSGSVEKSFEDDGAHEWVVPAGVCSVWIDAFGAEGGGVPADADGGVPIVGGLGGRATAKIAVTPGETLWVNVGGEGEDSNGSVAGEGGFNGGGDGGRAFLGEEDDVAGGGGGGGASDVRQGRDALDHRVVVAGGGGGAGGGSENGGAGEIFGSGGDGGGEEGDDGQTGQAQPDPAQAGEGGGESDGGDGGIVDPATLNGDDGEAGEGGDGGGAPTVSGNDGGGGGGGGWFGGGGGAGGGLDVTGNTTDGAGGGGGSGFGPDDTDFETGEQDGDGEVTISYDPVADACVTEAIVVEPNFTG